MKTVHQSNKRLHILLGMWLACVVLSMAMASCGGHGSRQLRREVDSFAVYYFNWQFHKAIRYVTPESGKWIRYAASQVHGADIDLLRQKEQPATCEIHNITYNDADTTAVAHVIIRDFLRMDTIGRAASLVTSADYDIPLVFNVEKDRWMVSLHGMLRENK